MANTRDDDSLGIEAPKAFTMSDTAHRDSAEPGPAARAAWLLVVVAAAWLGALWHVASSISVLSLDRLASFEEPAPFQHRVLVPLGVAAARHLTGGDATHGFWAAEWVGWSVLILAATAAIERLAPRTNWTTVRLAALTVIASVGVQLTGPSRFRTFSGSQLLGDINGLYQGANSVVTLPNVFYPWDVWSAALLLLLIARLIDLRVAVSSRRLVAAAVVFVVACLNRETAIFIVPFSVWALAPVLSCRRLIALAAAEVLLWAAVVGGVAWLVDAPPNPRASLPGGVYQWLLWTNLKTLTYPLYALTTVLPFSAGAWLVIVCGWRRAPEAARTLVLAYAVPVAALTFAFGILHETRAFTEPAAALWAAAASAALASVPPRGDGRT